MQLDADLSRDRLEKLEQILQVDLSDSETMNELWLALALQRLSDVPDR